MSREIKKILVIKLSALGDFVLALAARISRAGRSRPVGVRLA